MRLSDATIASAPLRRLRKAISLKETLERRYAWYAKNLPQELGLSHYGRKKTIADLCQRAIDADGQLWEINTSLSSRDDVLKLPTKQITNWIFHNLPQPRPAQQTDFQQTIIETMNQAGRDGRSKRAQTLISLEIAYRTKQQYFLLFNTLTVRKDTYRLVFTKNSTEFKNYIRRIERLIPNSTTKEPKHTYFACVEEGAKNGRLHIHVLHFMQKIPPNWVDPNKGKRLPKQWEIHRAKKLWEHGWSTPIAVRYSPTDAYGQLGWRWPVDHKDYTPKQIGSPLRLATYLGKYITKSYTSKKRSKLLWRIRKTQNLGKNLMTDLLSTLTPEELLSVATCNSLNLKINNQRLPTKLLRIHALSIYENFASTTKECNTLLTLGKTLEPMPSLLQYAKGSTKTTQTNNLRNIGTIQTLITNGEDTFNKAWSKLKIQRQQINNKYFKPVHQTYGYGTSRDHIYAAPKSPT